VYEYFAIWSIWSGLPLFYKLYWLLLSLVSIYTLFSAASIVRRVSISNCRDDLSESSQIRLEAVITNLGRVIGALFFAFSALFFWALPGAFQTISLSRSLPLNEIIGTFSVHFAFAAKRLCRFTVITLCTVACFQTSSFCEVNPGK
jgi:hypothetical protein